MIDTDELIQNLSAAEYDEPDDINYLIVKTTEHVLNDNNGDLYKSSRMAWCLNINRVSRIKYVLSSIGGVVKEVYDVGNWYCSENRTGLNSMVTLLQNTSVPYL